MFSPPLLFLFPQSACGMRLEDTTSSQEWKMRSRGQAQKFTQRSTALNSTNSKLGCFCSHDCLSWHKDFLERNKVTSCSESLLNTIHSHFLLIFHNTRTSVCLYLQNLVDLFGYVTAHINTACLNLHERERESPICFWKITEREINSFYTTDVTGRCASLDEIV